MQLTPREIDKLMIYTLSDVALRRKARGLKLNFPKRFQLLPLPPWKVPAMASRLKMS